MKRIELMGALFMMTALSAPRILFDGPFDDRDPHIAQICNVYENPTGYE
jgi:hypothetical protein